VVRLLSLWFRCLLNGFDDIVRISSPGEVGRHKGAAARRGLELATYTIGADGDFQEDGDWAKL
jgi:hypothetical protein